MRGSIICRVIIRLGIVILFHLMDPTDMSAQIRPDAERFVTSWERAHICYRKRLRVIDTTQKERVRLSSVCIREWVCDKKTH